MKAIAGKWAFCHTETIFFCPLPVVPISQYKGTLLVNVVLLSANVEFRISHTLTTKFITEINKYAFILFQKLKSMHVTT